MLSSLRAAVSLTLTLGTTPLTNNSVVVITDIGDVADGSPLICTTTFTPCCKDGKQGEWYYPDGTVVPDSTANEDFFRNRGDDGEVRLNRIRNNAISPTGIFHCELPGPNGVTQTLYVGVYASNDNGEMFSS